jgi:hypothetical protein
VEQLFSPLINEGVMAQKTDKPTPIQIQKFLGGIDYPADKATCVKTAKENGADEDVMSMLNQLGEQHYNSPNDVSEEIGKIR